MLENTVFFFPRIMSRMLEKRSLSYIDGPVPVPLHDPFLTENVERIRICDTGMFYFVYKLNGFIDFIYMFHGFVLRKRNN